jgi:tetratricopeptide (TPR) repeat protein
MSLTLPPRQLAVLGPVAFLAALVYWTGLSGGFWFDDESNLRALGAYGGVRDARSFWLYLTSGAADPTGRPLSMLSFLIDARDWPADPAPFKLTNLLIHLLNTVLLARVLSVLGGRAGLAAAHAGRAAVLGAALWALHPLWVSTVLYVVQRHAMLPVTFLLIAFLLWETAWRRLERGHTGSAWLYGFVGVGLASLCAFLSKANGALTPLLVALAWWMIYRPALAAGGGDGALRGDLLQVSMRRQARNLAFWALLLPSALVVLALLAQIPGAVESAEQNRPWPLWQRALSQPRALIDYLGLLWLPREGSSGIFADHFVVSTGLYSPWTTLAALLATAGLIVAALWRRRRRSLLALAILFFFTGHLVESGWLPLEPYFEHRNYLPALLLFWPLAVWLTAASADRLSGLRRGLVWALPLLLAMLTLFRAGVWGDEATLSAHLVARNPDSPRAQLWQSSQEIEAGRFDLAVPRLLETLTTNPTQTALAWNLLHAECSAGVAHPDYLTLAEAALSRAPFWQKLDRDWLAERIAVVGQSGCPHYSADSLRALLAAAAANPRIVNNALWHQDVIGLRGELARATGDPDEAERLFRQALALEPRPDLALRTAAQWGNLGEPARGLAHLDWYLANYDFSMPQASGMAEIHNWLLKRDGYFEREVAILAAALREDATGHRARPKFANSTDTTAPSPDSRDGSTERDD